MKNNRSMPFGVWVAIFVAIWVPIIGITHRHYADDMPNIPAPPPAPAGLAANIVADSQADPWRVTNFINPFIRVDQGQVTSPEIPGGKALRIAVPEARNNLYDISVYSLSVRPVRAGDHLDATVWMRLAPTPGNVRLARVRVLIQESRKPYPVVADSYVVIGPQWQRYTVQANIHKAYAPGELNLTAHLASAQQTVDVGQGQVVVHSD